MISLLQPLVVGAELLEELPPLLFEPLLSLHHFDGGRYRRFDAGLDELLFDGLLLFFDDERLFDGAAFSSTVISQTFQHHWLLLL